MKRYRRKWNAYHRFTCWFTKVRFKPNPLCEDGGLAYFKTHYYGGIKKYQWTTIPLSIHGVIVKTNGEKIEIEIGEKETDPIFTITDLLPHLAQEQMEKKLKNGVEGEDLRLLIGSIPFTCCNKDGEEHKKQCGVSERVKLNILNLLNQNMELQNRFIKCGIGISSSF